MDIDVSRTHKGLALVSPSTFSLQRGGDMRNWIDSVTLLRLSSVMSVLLMSRIRIYTNTLAKKG
jgi:hypothetical protein